MRNMHAGMAGGQSGILPEMILHGGNRLHHQIHELIQVWRSGLVVSDWSGAIIVPIPKKGDLRSCDNWRGISLLDVAGKLFAQIIQNRLQHIAEFVLPDSQCGFRKGRGCVDMILVAWHLHEKTVEHQSQLCAVFVDLKKAYDSIPRLALWRVLEKLGVPPTMLSLIKSLHEGMTAQIRVSGNLTDSIAVCNGLRQGCTLAPTLFNLYFSAVMTSWRSQSTSRGVPVKYRIGRKLVGDRTAKSRLDAVYITESQFADDAVLYTISRPCLDQTVCQFVSCASRWGLTVSIEKTKQTNKTKRTR